MDRSSWYSHTFIKRFNGWQPGCHLWPPLVPIFLQAKLDMYGVDWGKKKPWTCTKTIYLLFVPILQLTNKSKQKLCTKKILPYFRAHKNNVLSNCEVAHFTSLLKLSTIIMKCLLFPPFSIIILLLIGGHNGADNNCIFNSKDPRKKTTSVIVIMCLQIWMQLQVLVPLWKS